MMKVDMMWMGMKDRVFVDMIEVGMRLMVWICRMLKVDMMRVDMMKMG